MTEIEDALRSCMEQLLLAREEREQLIVEAANQISSEQKRARDLQHKLEDASKKIAKLGAENNSLYKTIEAKDKLIKSLSESKAVSDGKLANANAKLEATQKQAASLQYEVRMLQKELEIRSQEREYDLKSVDAAHRQQAENLKKIAQLEAECQRLRTMIRKRLPGPAALAKMRDEVEQVGAGHAESRMRRPRSAAPLSPRPATPRGSMSESYMAKLRAIEEENKALKQMLAKRENELEFMQMKYADEACKLSVVQRQFKELSEESKHLDGADGISESWASALISELEHFKAGKGEASGRASDISMLDDLVEVEKLEIASTHQTSVPPSAPQRSVPNASPKNEDFRSVVPEKNGKAFIQYGSLFNNCPEWVQDILELIMHKHQASEKSFDTVLDEVRCALESTADSDKGGASIVSCDRSKLETIVTNLIEKVNCMIQRSSENNVSSCRSFFNEKPEFTARLEHLVHCCHDALDGKANLEKFLDEVCLILEYIVTQYFSPQDVSNIMENNTKNFDGDESLSTENVQDEHVIPSANSETVLQMQAEAQKEPIQPAEDQTPDDMLVNHQESQHVEEPATVTLDQDENSLPEKMSPFCEIESAAADRNSEDLTDQVENQPTTNSESEISAAEEKLIECQETITNLSRQLQALKSPANADTLERSMSNPKTSTVKSDYRPLSLASILAQEEANNENSISPTSNEVTCQKEHDETDAATQSNIAQEQDADRDLNAADHVSTQIIVHPMRSGPPQEAISTDPKKKKRGPGLLSRLIFRRKVEDSS